MVAAESREEDGNTNAQPASADPRALIHELSESLTAVGAYLETAELKIGAPEPAAADILRKGRDQLARANRALRELRAALNL